MGCVRAEEVSQVLQLGFHGVASGKVRSELRVDGRQLGYTRMWSIHPDQVRVIVDAFAPTAAEVDLAVEVVTAAEAAGWGPIRHRHAGREHLHDRASYRYFWQVLERAHRTSFEGDSQLPAEIRLRYFAR